MRAFEPLEAGKVGVYNCGPTVYDWQHIGNLYAYVVADTVRRSLEYLGYEVRQVMNITDVGHLVGDADEGEDKMAVGAAREKKDPAQLAEMYTQRFFEDRRKLGILDPHVVSKATEHIPEMIALIQRLMERGHAYSAADGVYFDVTTFPGYGTRLNAEPPQERMAGARVEVNPNKRNAADFALWRAAKPGDLQQWDSPWGRGNPGWHIECSAMSMKYLGETFDIHSGGEDHLFPHHECEIAQSEGATGKRFVDHWIHNRFLKVDNAKMAKSAGGFFQLRDLEAQGYDPRAFRLLALGTSYRKGLDYTEAGIEAAQQRLLRWRSAVIQATQTLQAREGSARQASEEESRSRSSGVTTSDAWSAKALPSRRAPGSRADEVGAGPGFEQDPLANEFRDAICDDVNTPRALAAAESALGLVNAPGDDERRRGLALLLDMDRVLALGVSDWIAGAEQLSDDERALLDERAKARERGDYARSDELRDLLLKRGIKVKDTRDGQRWERIVDRGNEGRT